MNNQLIYNNGGIMAYRGFGKCLRIRMMNRITQSNYAQHNVYVLRPSPLLNRLRPDDDKVIGTVYYRVGKSPHEKLIDPVDLGGTKHSWDQTFDHVNDKMRPWYL